MNNTELQELIKSYGSSIDPKITSRLTKLYELNNKYLLTEGTQDDFNNAARFLLTAQLKNSKLIDSTENDLSSLFGSVLLSYHNSYVNNDQLTQLTSKIITYNTAINDIYTINGDSDIDSIKSIMSNIYGISYDTYEITENSYAYNLLNILKKRYKQYYGIDKIEEDTGKEYGFTSYEQEFLIMITYDYILTKINNGIGLSLNKKNNETQIDYIRYSDNDEVLYTNPQNENEKDVISHFYTKNISVTNDTMKIYKNIVVGNAQDPYVFYSNDRAENNNRGFTTTIKIKNDDSTLDTLDITDFIRRNGALEATHIETNVTNYYVYDIKQILDNYPKLQLLELKRTGAPVEISTVYNIIAPVDENDKKLINEHCVYTNEILAKYEEYFNSKPNAENAMTFGDNTDTNDYRRKIDSESGSEELYKFLFQEINVTGSFSKELQIMTNTFKILYDFKQVNQNTSDGKSYGQLIDNEKRSASSLETYHSLKYHNMNYMTFTNILVDIDSDLYKNLKIMFRNAKCYIEDDLQNYGFKDIRTINNKKYITLSFSIIYKEFNTNIRAIDCSDIQNHLIGIYLSSADEKDFINERLYEIISNPTYLSFLDESNRQLFLSLKTNAFIIRNSAVDDIVSYLSGSYINFGINKTELNDIDTILKLYKECRDMFYMCLYNKAYSTEELYSTYVELYIRAFTIERFISSRLDNMTNLELMNKNDCRNFLLSYGLKILSDQIDKQQFADSLTYEKRIIANYCELMSKKGSSAVINKFFEIFDYNTTEIEIYKYLLLKDNSIEKDKDKKSILTSSKIKFIPVQYRSTDINMAITENIDKAVEYEKFVEKDKYWDADEVQESVIDELFDSPVTTKYLGIDLKKDIYEAYIKTRYILSLNKYLYNKLDFSNTTADNLNDNLNIYKYLTYETEDFGEISIVGTYKFIELLFKLFVHYSEKYYKIDDDPLFPDDESAIPNFSDSNLIRYYGINENTTIATENFSFYNTTYLKKDMLKSLFKRRYLKYMSDSDGYSISDDDKFIYYYTKSSTITPYDLLVNANADKKTLGYLLFSSETDNTIGAEFKYLLPLKVTSQRNGSQVVIFDSPVYRKLKASAQEIMTDTVGTNNYNNSTIDVFDDMFNSISMINFLNTSSEDEDYYDKFNAIYQFNRFKDNNGQYPLQADQLGKFIGDENEIGLENFNFYSYIYDNCLSFPLNYINGKFNNSKEINYDINAKRITDEIFEKYYTTTNPNGLGYYTNKTTSNEINDDIQEIANIFAITDSEYGKTPDNSTIITAKRDAIISKLTEMNAITSNTSFVSETGDELKEVIENLTDAINTMSSDLNAALEMFNHLKLDLNFGNNISNFFDFIKTCITFFISYTSYLYQSNLIYKIDTEAEQIPLTYQIEEQISNTLVDYFYSDESVDIIEI